MRGFLYCVFTFGILMTFTSITQVKAKPQRGECGTHLFFGVLYSGMGIPYKQPSPGVFGAKSKSSFTDVLDSVKYSVYSYSISGIIFTRFPFDFDALRILLCARDPKIFLKVCCLC